MLVIRAQDHDTKFFVEGSPAFHGAQVTIDATLVSHFRADGEPHRRCTDENVLRSQQKANSSRAFWSYESQQASCPLGEIGDRLSEETHTCIRLLATAKKRCIPESLRTRACQSWTQRRGFTWACAATLTFASSLLHRRDHAGTVVIVLLRQTLLGTSKGDQSRSDTTGVFFFLNSSSLIFFHSFFL